eukprot:gb/GECH01007415.1/.p1 GENE.gb/GECH01007415.1/~~gb/GECH01007415.1/.p1  ORF type:complete len:295 (+),score=14.45 gb/GECH01007415.1/:1-885(+)
MKYNKESLGRACGMYGPRESANLFKVSPSTALYWKKKLNNPEFRCHKHGGKRSQKYSDNDLKNISDVLWTQCKRDPATTLKSFCHELHSHGYELSRSWVYTFFVQRGWSWQVAGFELLNKYTPDNVAYYGEYIQWFPFLNWSQLKFVDEAHFSSRKNTIKKASSPRGKTPVLRTSGSLNFQLSLICLTDINHDPPFHAEILEGTVDQNKFIKFVGSALVSGRIKNGDALVLDNATTHTSQEGLTVLIDMCESEGVMVIFQPKYSPELNPVELVFNTCKKFIRNISSNSPLPYKS